MNLNDDICYKALLSRDARFDGRFFTGVRTTGIYCRPVCPAVAPLRKNVVFLPTAAAAEAAGFRPCLRCRPETAPGTPAWLGTSTSVSRGLRLINTGYLDSHSVTDLADCLGLGERHLTRLFKEHLGASPVAIAQTRRVHFARNLLEQSDLGMTRVALAAGFGSVQRFNYLVKKVFGMTPTRLRSKSRHKPVAGGLTFKLPFREPYDWPALLSYLQGRAIPGVESVSGDTYRRTLLWGGKPGVMTVTRPAAQSHLRLTLEVASVDGIIDLVSRARRMFDCGADPALIADQLGDDPLLKPLLCRRPGLRLPVAWDPFELTVRAILGQQVSVAAATTVSGRIATRFGTLVQAQDDPALTHLFPDAKTLATADLSGLGLTGRRAATVTSFATAVADGRVDLDPVGALDDFMANLTALPGIGPWTAQYVAMRALGEPDAFPASDLGLKKAAPTVDLAVHSEHWRPWRAYAALHLWQSLADGE